MQYTNQPMKEYLFVAMKQISGPDDYPYVFYLERPGGGVWLERSWAGSDAHWHPGDRFVFRFSSLRK